MSREVFEAEYRNRNRDRLHEDIEHSLRLDGCGEYACDATFTAFYWWQAATSAQEARVKELEEALRDAQGRLELLRAIIDKEPT